jgi:membrane protein implicated in regulation of membrane protease activity
MAFFNLRSMSFAVIAVVLAALVAPRLPAAAGASAHLHVYMHDVLGDSAMIVVKGPRGVFGNTVVMDDVLTDGTAATSAAVGRAQGQYVVASSKGGFELMVTMNVVLTSGPYAGSSVTVMGRDDTGVAVRELAVVGGTGQFRMARGYVLWKTVRPDLLELDIYVNP